MAPSSASSFFLTGGEDAVEVRFNPLWGATAAVCHAQDVNKAVLRGRSTCSQNADSYFTSVNFKRRACILMIASPSSAFILYNSSDFEVSPTASLWKSLGSLELEINFRLLFLINCTASYVLCSFGNLYFG